jgi:toxin YoeB
MNTKKARNKTQAKSVSVAFTKNGWEDYQHWQTNDKQMVDAINRLLSECLRDPFKGTGRPEPLVGSLTGYWSRRIDREHRLVYLPEDGVIYVLACRYHYSK